MAAGLCPASRDPRFDIHHGRWLCDTGSDPVAAVCVSEGSAQTPRDSQLTSFLSYSPKPPPASLADRLTQASMLAGSSSSMSSKGVQHFVSQLAASLGMSSSGGARWSVKSTQDYLASLRTTDLVRAGLDGADAVASKLEVLAARLGVSRENTSRFAATLDVLQQRAQLWTSSARSHSPRLHQGVLGWIGALAGASGVFLLILGATGLLGVFVVPIRRGEQTDSVKTEQKKQR